MSWRDWDSYRRPRRPSRTAIVAQAQRGRFGATWWGRKWLAAIEMLCDEGRLSRGRSYARHGQVESLSISTKGIEATVQGSWYEPYSVTIRCMPMPDHVWTDVSDQLGCQAWFAARLLAGEMPEQIDELFAADGMSIFPNPEIRDDLGYDCSCYDWEKPCKHIAAVFYLVAERLDADPLLMFVLRGRDREEVLDALQRGQDVAAPGASKDEDGEPAGTPLWQPDAPVPDFWRGAGLPAEPTRVPVLPRVDAEALKRLGLPPFASGRAGFTRATEDMYRAITREAGRLASRGN